MTSNNDLLIKCLKEIEKKINWIDSKQWQQTHFESLSELIFEKTKVSLSPLTLKRLWGKIKYESQPSASTLDALARFLEYTNWIDYQIRQKESNAVNFRLVFLKYKKAIIFVTTALILIITILLIQPYFNTKNYLNYEFSVEPLTSSVPNTVYFKYNVKNTDAESVMIQQSWDQRLRHSVDKNKTDYSCIYYYPGYYRAKLVLDEKIVAEDDLYIKSNGWMAAVKKEPVPYYLPIDSIYDGNKLVIKERHLRDAGFDLKNEIPHVTIYLIEEFQNIYGKNFELTADFKQTYPKGEAICQKSIIRILCSNGHISIPFSAKGCVNELKMIIPDKYISAQDVDLRNLGVENSDTIHLKVNVTEGILNITVNNTQNICDTLTIDPGKVVGIKFGFHGTGELYSFNIKSEDNNYTMSDFLP